MDPYEKLCTKDPRYPMFNDIHGDEDEKPTPRQDCACDNCFYGRDAMALEIIALQEQAASYRTGLAMIRNLRDSEESRIASIYLRH